MTRSPGAYAGIGSRSTPPDVLEMMRLIASTLGRAGWTLRTGGAEGADTAFADGARAAGAPIELYRPHHVTPAAWKLAEDYHPAWHRLSGAAKGLIARNGYQVLGAGLNDPSKRVICWTPDGVETGATTRATGGTGQAIRIAAAYGIPISNLGNPATRATWAAILAHKVGWHDGL